MLLMIDNYDSFTYNVVQYLGELGAEVVVVRNDDIAVTDIAAMAPEKIVILIEPFLSSSSYTGIIGAATSTCE